MKNQNEIKWIDGRLVQGAYRQWLVDKHPEALEIKAIDIIARHTLGYRKRYAYIKSDLFNMHTGKKSRQLKLAKGLGLIEYEKTHGYTMYKLILPEEIENKTLWRGNNQKPIIKENNNGTESWGEETEYV